MSTLFKFTLSGIGGMFYESDVGRRGTYPHQDADI